MKFGVRMPEVKPSIHCFTAVNRQAPGLLTGLLNYEIQCVCGGGGKGLTTQATVNLNPLSLRASLAAGGTSVRAKDSVILPSVPLLILCMHPAPMFCFLSVTANQLPSYHSTLSLGKFYILLIRQLVLLYFCNILQHSLFRLWLFL